MKNKCSNINHKKFYLYTCKKCLKEDCGKKLLPSGSWCNCECRHNTYFCSKCLKPVLIISGVYYYVLKEDKKLKDKQK